MLKESYTAASSFPVKLLHQKVVQDNKIIPLHVQFSPTNLCNLHCSFCSCANSKKTDVLSFDSVKKIFSDYKELGTTAVTITGGGEPLLYPHINETIEYINSLGIKIGLTTNGTQFKKISSEVLKLIVWCRISASDDRKLPFSTIPFEAPIDWAFSYVVTSKLNYRNLIAVINFANNHKFTHVRVVSDLLDLSNIVKMKKIAKRLKDKGISDHLVIYQDRQKYTLGTKRCLISLLKPVVAADGKIYPCCGVQYALKNPSRDFEKTMMMDYVDSIKKIYHDQSFFNGENCIRCYYSDYNEALELLTQDLTHIEFV